MDAAKGAGQPFAPEKWSKEYIRHPKEDESKTKREARVKAAFASAIKPTAEIEEEDPGDGQPNESPHDPATRQSRTLSLTHWSREASADLKDYSADAKRLAELIRWRPLNRQDLHCVTDQEADRVKLVQEARKTKREKPSHVARPESMNDDQLGSL